MAEPQGRSRVSFQRANRIEGFDEEDQPEEQVTPPPSRSGGPSMVERALANAAANREAGQARLDAADERRRNEPVREPPQASPENEARLRAALSARRKMEADIAASREPMPEPPLGSSSTRTYPPMLSEGARNFHEGLRQGSAATTRGGSNNAPAPVSAPVAIAPPSAPASTPAAPPRPPAVALPAAPPSAPSVPRAEPRTSIPSVITSGAKEPDEMNARPDARALARLRREMQSRAPRPSTRSTARMSPRDTSSDELNEISQSVSSRRGGAEMEPGRTGDIARRIAAREAELSPMKRGGPVKKMAKGGVVKSSASSRSDGCVTKGRTKGRVV